MSEQREKEGEEKSEKLSESGEKEKEKSEKVEKADSQAASGSSGPNLLGTTLLITPRIFLGTSEKNSIILELGGAYTKCGFAGESKPRFIIPTELKLASGKEISFLWATLGKEIVSQHDWEEALEMFLNGIFFKYLQTNPKDRKAVICETPSLPKLCKAALKVVLRNKLKLSSLVFVPMEDLYLIPLGTSTGLVVDCGYLETRIIPFFEGYPIKTATESSPVGGHSVLERLQKLLFDYGIVYESSTPSSKVALAQYLDYPTLEAIMTTVCFVEPVQPGNLGAVPSIVFPFPKKNLEVSGAIRGKPANVYFEPDEEGLTIANLILNSLLKCPIDSRRGLASKILFVGGCSMYPGFRQRVLHSVRAYLSKPIYKNLSALKFGVLSNTYPANYLGWIGASVVGCLESLTSSIQEKDTTKSASLSQEKPPSLQEKVTKSSTSTPEKDTTKS